MHRRLPLALSLAFFALFAAACGDGGDAASTIDSAATIAAQTPGTSSTQAVAAATVDTKIAPRLSAPASRFTLLLLEDIGRQWITDIRSTYVLTADNYSKTKSFDSPEKGMQLLKEWGYVGGYESAMTPEGREAAVLNGSYYISIESHLFEDEVGAKKAYDYFLAKLRGGSQEIASAPVGNESAAFTLTVGKVGKSSINATFHQVVFRRGNLVVVVATWGAEPFMKTDDVYRLALIVDDKALSKREALEPTPTSNFSPPTVAQRSPTTATTPSATVPPASSTGAATPSATVAR